MNQKLQWQLTPCALFLTFTAQTPNALAQGTAFTYQGRLNDGGPAANGSYDLKFTLFDASAAGNALGSSPVTNANLSVSNGRFTATQNFGVGGAATIGH
jgi:hypothetical protein